MAASMENLPSDYDAIVLGTGMTECIIAAALSRNGYKVLHLDRNDYYSGDWACFHFKALQEWIKTKQDPQADLIEIKSSQESVLEEGEAQVPLRVQSDTVRNIQQHVYVREKREIPQESAQCSGKTTQNKTNEDSKQDKNETLANTCESEEAASVKSENESTIKEHAQTDLNRDNSENKELSDSLAKVAIDEKKVDSNSETCDKKSKAEETSAKSESETAKSETSGDNVIAESESDIKEMSSPEQNVCTETSESEEETMKREWSFEEIQTLWRKFNIDLMPKMLYCRGPMVELLISSDVAKYCEFKTVSRVLTAIKGKLEQVPCSRSDVFGSKQVSMIEKRMMMKFLTFCMDYQNQPDQYKGSEEQPFSEFLRSKKLSANVQHYIQHSIAMVTDDTSTIKGLEASQLFLQSLGRYGNTAFLWPVYGSGELPQCFCRMCAVFGGVYCLRRTAQAMVVDAEKKCQGIVDTEGQRLNAKWLILESSFASEQILTSPVNRYTSRAILVTDRSLKLEAQEHITLMSQPNPSGESPVHMFELPASSYACPKGLYLVHLTCVCQHGAQQDFKEIMESLFQEANKENDGTSEETSATDSRPQILWSLMFEIADTTSCQATDTLPSNVFLVGGPNHVLDFRYSIDRAKEIFEEICPGEEFLPKAPNPEDIIWDDGVGNQPTESGFEPKTDSDEPKENDGDQPTGSIEAQMTSEAKQNDGNQAIESETEAEESVSAEKSQNSTEEKKSDGNQAVDVVNEVVDSGN